VANQYVRNPMRMRNVHFKIFQNHQLDDAELETGLPLFKSLVGLWCCADREGRFEWDTRKLRANIFPYRSDRELDFSKVLDFFLAQDIVRKYEVEGKSYGWLVTFKMYQYLSGKEASSLLPEQPWCSPGALPDSTGCTLPNSDVSKVTIDDRRLTNSSDDQSPEANNTVSATELNESNGEAKQDNVFTSFNDAIETTIDAYPMKPNNTNVRKKWKLALETEIESLYEGLDKHTSRFDIALTLHDRVLTYAEAKPDKVYTLENWLKNGVYQQSWVAANTYAITPAETEKQYSEAHVAVGEKDFVGEDEGDTFKVEDVDDSDGLS
jgi:hypothetical protein